MLPMIPAGGTHRAVVIDRHGGPDVLRIRDVPPVVAGPGEVSVNITHVALNHLDLWVRRGVPPDSLGRGHDFHLPRIPGSDVAGEADGAPVVLLPSWGCGTCAACLAGRANRCRAFRIRGENTDGGCRTSLVAPRWQLLPIPPHLSPAEAVGLPLTLLTAWHMLVTRARLSRGERVLVQAGASGVGLMAIQIARLFDCEVHATASTAPRRERLEALGARAWPYDGVPGGFDVVVESVGETTWDSSVRALAWGGRLVCCGATSGPDVRLNLRVLFFKQIEILGSTMGNHADLHAAWREVTAGHIRPIIDRVVSMRAIGRAHEALERREAFGKIVLTQDLA